MTYFATFDDAGRVTGYYPADRQPDAPHVALSDEQWRSAIQLTDPCLVDGEIVSVPTPLGLVELKARLKLLIDAEAERQRLRWITPGAGQAMTYARKVDQARAVLAATEPRPAQYPMLAASIGIDGADIVAVANTIIAMDAAWEAIGAAIEEARLAGKKAIDNAGTVELAKAVQVTWPG